MSRYNAWFFGGKSPAYDKLVSMTIDKIDDIIYRIYPKILRYAQKPTPVNEFFYPKNDRPIWCLSDFQTSFRTPPVCLESTESNPLSLVYSSFGELKLPRTIRVCPESTWARYDSTPEDICEQLNDLCELVELEEGSFFFYWGEVYVKSNIDGKYVDSVQPYYVHKIYPMTSTIEAYNVDWETKSICKDDDGKLLGLADIVFDFEIKTRNEYNISDIETWRERDQEYNLRLVAKVEPKPNSWDIPHGKLKVFMDNLSKHHNPNDLPLAGIIPTFSKAPPVVHERLEKDNIYIITFTQKGEISDGFEPEQMRL